MRKRVLKVAAAALTLAACGDQGPAGPIDGTRRFSTRGDDRGAVYAMTNAVANTVVRYERAADGTLSAPASFATGGTGSGAGLGSQGALAFALDNRFLLAVNAASNNVSVFRIDDGELQLVDRTASGGVMPVSVAVHGQLIYVVNAGGRGNVSGFRLSPMGELSAIDESTQPLSARGAGPAQISFSPDGKSLVVTEKNTNRILIYPVNAAGVAGRPLLRRSVGSTPFGFAFGKRNVLLVSEAFGGTPNASATSSYLLAGTALVLKSSSVPTTETAACWAVVTNDGKFVYVTNTGSGSVTGYEVGRDGSLSILDADGVTGVTGGAPIDADVSAHSRFLYVLNGGGFISVFAVAVDGSLSRIGSIEGLPAGSSGLVAR